MPNITCADLTGKVVGISVKGSGIDTSSAELIIRFAPSDGSALSAYRLGARAAIMQFL